MMPVDAVLLFGFVGRKKKSVPYLTCITGACVSESGYSWNVRHEGAAAARFGIHREGPFAVFQAYSTEHQARVFVEALCYPRRHRHQPLVARAFDINHGVTIAAVIGRRSWACTELRTLNPGLPVSGISSKNMRFTESSAPLRMT
jgi:GTP-dependent phosphoenolpyruvate carboxykinase